MGEPHGVEMLVHLRNVEFYNNALPFHIPFSQSVSAKEYSQ